ncbi:carbohydrate ABC transporter permease [Falsihalocynthiibacter arcticus]|uniref:Sugar ABC transporter permease n=1 Tax=Falsihalocynthiibacter arcticus TaxID=1579316 RepID=A0A126V4V7_9RHOB|nr:sugar ABC transporter permease [Falsihalocynthiibacter arcticus]AML53338.1 sugar ABC transporter permease [Falsihalocynthiibacter arcticus]
MTDKALKSRLSRSRTRSAWLFLAPMLVTLFVVAAWPLGRTIWFSFTDASLDMISEARWVGFRNYLEYVDWGDGNGQYYGILVDARWWRSVINTIVFALASVSLETVFGLIIALVLNQKFRGRGFVRAAVLIPWAIPTIVSAKMWAWMLHDQFGIINDMLQSLGLITEPIAWTASPSTAMIAVLMVDVWKTTPFMALLILAGLQMVPQDIYEAAKLDGVPAHRVFRKVTLPLIMPAVLVAVVFRALDALRIFDIVYVLTPNTDATRTMSVFARENLFDYDKFAYGSAASTLLFLVIALITIAFIMITRMDLEGKRS